MDPLTAFGHNNEHKFRQLFENGSEIFQIVDPIFVDDKVVDFVYKRVNDACAHLIEKNREDIEGKTDKEVWGHINEDRIKLLEDVLKSGYSFREHTYNREADAYINVHAWQVERGQIAILLTNITKFKKISEALLKEKEQSEFEKQRLYAILETSPSAIIVLEAPDGRFSYLNKRALDLYGVDYTGFELESHFEKVKTLKLDGSPYRVEETPASRALYQGDVVRNEEMLFRREDGITIPLSVSAAPIYSTNGMITSAVTMFENISERRQAEDALRESEQKATLLVKELEESDKNKNQFIGVLAHELRNPLAAISAGVEVLEIAREPHQADKAKAIIKRQTSHLCQLVQDLLDLTRITHNKIILKKRNIDLNEIIQGAIEDIRSQYVKKGIKLTSNIQIEPIPIMADPVRITQILENVLFNALKFTQENGEVLVTLSTNKDHALITIKDSGIGMSADILPDLFKPFFQADHSMNSGTSYSLGLGLSIVKEIVDLHGGKVIGFSEGLGEGSSFTISLPLQMEDQTRYLPK